MEKRKIDFYANLTKSYNINPLYSIQEYISGWDFDKIYTQNNYLASGIDFDYFINLLVYGWFLYKNKLFYKNNKYSLFYNDRNYKNKCNLIICSENFKKQKVYLKILKSNIFLSYTLELPPNFYNYLMYREISHPYHYDKNSIWKMHKYKITKNNVEFILKKKSREIKYTFEFYYIRNIINHSNRLYIVTKQLFNPIFYKNDKKQNLLNTNFFQYYSSFNDFCHYSKNKLLYN